VAELHVAGTGSFALELVEYARAVGHDVVALLELLDPGRVGGEAHGLPIVGPVEGPGFAVVGLAGNRLALWSQLAGTVLVRERWSALPPRSARKRSSRAGRSSVITPASARGLIEP
jgi:hypothetical protein